MDRKERESYVLENWRRSNYLLSLEMDCTERTVDNYRRKIRQYRPDLADRRRDSSRHKIKEKHQAILDNWTLSNGELSDMLFLSESTIEKHRRHLRSKDESLDDCRKRNGRYMRLK